MSPLIDSGHLSACVTDHEALDVALPDGTIQPIPPGVLRRYLDNALGDADLAAAMLAEDICADLRD